MPSKSFTSLEKAMDILLSFDLDHPKHSAQEISKRLSMRLSSTYRYLDVLVRKGFLAKDHASTKYRLGLTLFKLGNLAGAEIRVGDVALPYMKELSARSGESILLTVLSGHEAVCLERIEARKLIKLSLDRGASLPLHAGASSRVLLAYQEESFVDDMIAKRGLSKLTENTITDPVKLKMELEKTRILGYAFSNGEADPGARAVAAPIFDHKAKMIGGLTIPGPTERIKRQNILRLAEMVTSIALKTSNELGYEAGKKT
jgi:DNA-binding IclR family transcriptional regulator